MNKRFKKFLLCIGEIIIGTALWSLLDFLFKDNIDIITNFISVSSIVLLCNITDLISKKLKRKK